MQEAERGAQTRDERTICLNAGPVRRFPKPLSYHIVRTRIVSTSPTIELSYRADLLNRLTTPPVPGCINFRTFGLLGCSFLLPVAHFGYNDRRMRAQSRQFRPNRLLPRAVPRSADASVASISPILKVIALVIFLPEEISFYIFQFRLTLIRLVLFLLTPVLLIHFGQLLASGKRHLFFPIF